VPADHWRKIYGRFDPEQPATNPDWRAPRSYNTVDSIDAALNRAFGDKHFLLLGTVGTGKSTELYRLRSLQEKRGFGVVFFDINQHFQRAVSDPAALQHIQPWEVLFLVGLSVYSAGQRAKHDWAPALTKRLETVAKQLSADAETPRGAPEIDIPRLAGAIVSIVAGPLGGGVGEKAVQAGLEAATAVATAAEWKLPIGIPGRKVVRDQDTRVHELSQIVNELLRDLVQERGQLTIILDGLDRITSPVTTQQLFTESMLLAGLESPVVVSGPLGLQRRRLASQVRGFDVKVLANLPVLDQAKPNLPGPGCAFFRDLFSRRVADLRLSEELVPQDQLDRLAYYSGGRARDFVRLIRMVAERASDRGLGTADAQAVDDAIDERRRLMESGLDRGIIDVLRSVMVDPEHVLPDYEGVEALLDQFALLPYPNQSEWYYPHPLLTMRRVRLG
jgi:hypothetical protein